MDWDPITIINNNYINTAVFSQRVSFAVTVKRLLYYVGTINARDQVRIPASSDKQECAANITCALFLPCQRYNVHRFSVLKAPGCVGESSNTGAVFRVVTTQWWENTLKAVSVSTTFKLLNLTMCSRRFSFFHFFWDLKGFYIKAPQTGGIKNITYGVWLVEINIFGF